jgi:5-formyltetrahydrofolate cyclo-ligase
MNCLAMANSRLKFSDKSRLRDALGQRLKELSPDERHLRSLRICEKLSSLFSGRKSVALFAPKLTEPDLDLFWDLDLLGDHLVSYPRCEGKALSFHVVSALSELLPGRFGIREPRTGLTPERLDLIVVPGLAFTAAGHRLGHGAGFYDRFLSALPPTTVKIGVCFEFQLLPEIPHESHDALVDAVVTA